MASAELSLPDVLPAIGISFDGNWSLSASTPAFPETATRSGTYTGYVSTSSVSCNLNPNVADNNVVLIGTIVDGVYAGTWVLESDAGPEPMGTFRLSPGR